MKGASHPRHMSVTPEAFKCSSGCTPSREVHQSTRAPRPRLWRPDVATRVDMTTRGVIHVHPAHVIQLRGRTTNTCAEPR